MFHFVLIFVVCCWFPAWNPKATKTIQILHDTMLLLFSHLTVLKKCICGFWFRPTRRVRLDGLVGPQSSWSSRGSLVSRACGPVGCVGSWALGRAARGLGSPARWLAERGAWQAQPPATSPGGGGRDMSPYRKAHRRRGSPTTTHPSTTLGSLI